VATAEPAAAMIEMRERRAQAMTEPKGSTKATAARRRALAFAAGMALLLLGGAVGLGEEEATKAARGRVTYRSYCSNCHGETADGKGHLTPLLNVKPSDLTHLADKDGIFPEERVRHSIDGRAEVAAHGQREMPVWGDFFQDSDGTPEGVARAQAKIDDLVAYLKSIQKAE
jgi:mono/diheme cytochrome c family protein